MILALDVGNSQIFGGVFEHGALTIRFRKPSKPPTSSDELGLFLRGVLRENGGDPAAVRQITLCSVVPEIVYSLRSCCRKYFAIDPFVLQAGVKTGLKIRYRNPLEVGADRIANAIAAALYPHHNVIVVDLGTATTFDVVRAGREFLGGIILPGLQISMEALERSTARLPTVEIVPAEEASRGTSTKSVRSFRSMSRSRSSRRGCFARSFGSSNCVGLTKMLTSVRSFSALLRRTSDRWP